MSRPLVVGSGIVTALFFASGEGVRAWLEEHHATASELWVGIYKKGSGKTGVTLQQALDQALCFGWIDSKGRRIDEHRYTVRFTPRRPDSQWSPRNLARFEELHARGLVHEAGLRALGKRRAVPLNRGRR
jgi:uncharacterized protein YdeI (YjbR/CyaY-like superfamily)